MKVITVTMNPALDYTIHTSNDWTRGEVNRVDSMDFSCGGKGLKVAVNLNIAGVEASVTGFMGALNDQRFCDLFKKFNVQDDFIRVADKETRRNIKIVSDKDGETTDFNLTGIAVDEAQRQQLIKLIDEQLPQAEVLMFGGSLPPGTDANFYVEMIKRYKNSGKFLVVDTSGKALETIVNADVLPDMIKPNIHELEEITGKKFTTDEEIIAFARNLINRGMKIVVVSMGSDGAWFVTKEEALHASPPRVKIVSTVGAGDAMVAGTICGYLAGYDLTNIAKNGTAFGAANVENMGSFISNMQRVNKLRDRVVIIDEGEER